VISRVFLNGLASSSCAARYGNNQIRITGFNFVSCSDVNEIKSTNKGRIELPRTKALLNLGLISATYTFVLYEFISSKFKFVHPCHVLQPPIITIWDKRKNSK